MNASEELLHTAKMQEIIAQVQTTLKIVYTSTTIT